MSKIKDALDYIHANAPETTKPPKTTATVIALEARIKRLTELDKTLRGLIRAGGNYSINDRTKTEVAEFAVRQIETDISDLKTSLEAMK